ncbi:MAG: tRNA lysidine(34) synthetase TilS [Novosphingobium sp.]|nr:tRNA lysidine(34) synthetase TilS [Novosphingobium sp.]
MFSGRGRLGLAVSGGPDSLALLLLAHEAMPGRFEVATVDHGLRPEGAAEAAMVERLYAKRGIAHATLRPHVALTGNLQAEARAARYAALGEWAGARGLGAIVTAHHRDDQAETLVMRLNRGAGVRGLAGMRGAAAVPGHPGVPLLRPLLGWSRAELAAIVANAGLPPADDPSNRDRRFERVAVRAALTEADWLDPAALAASAAHLAEADEALEWAAAREWEERVELGSGGLAYRPSAPRAIRLRVLERILAELGREGTPRGSEVARLDGSLVAGGTATLAGVRASVDGEAWRFAPAPPRRTA